MLRIALKVVPCALVLLTPHRSSHSRVTTTKYLIRKEKFTNPAHGLICLYKPLDYSIRLTARPKRSISSWSIMHHVDLNNRYTPKIGLIAALFLAAQYSNSVDSTTSVQMVDFMFKTLPSAVACVEIRFEAKQFFNSIDNIEA